jgi:antitoxin component YwqK of YwqJK toxin-antitoxin module
MKKVLLLFVCINISFLCYSQIKDTLMYYNSVENRIVDPEKASIVAVVKMNDKGMYTYKSYYIFSKTISTEGECYDLYNHQKEGEQIHYFPNGNVESISHYSNGRRNGVFVSFYPNGIMKDSVVYNLDWPVGAYNTWHMNGNPEIVAQFDSVKKGTGIFVSFFSNGNVACKGRYDFGLRKVGQWNYYHVNGNRAAVVQFPKTNESRYGNQVFITKDPFENFSYDSSQSYTDIKYYDEYGVQIDSMTHHVDRVAQFGKNDQVWDNYLTNAIRQKVQSYNVTGVMSYDMYYTVNEEGKTTEIQIGNKVEPEFDSFVKNAIRSSGKWRPAMQYGREIPMKNESHISFTVTVMYH